MKVDYEIALEVASHEAIVRKAYKDSVGKWTWSVGLTSATGHDVTRYIDKPASLEKCLAVYAWALERYADQVRQVFKGYTLTKAQFAAALSFHWNTGAIKRASWVKKWKAGDKAGARRAFMNWITPKSIAGRRRAERDLFFDGKWNNNGTMVEYTRLSVSYQPIWSSAKRIDVTKELKAAFHTPVVTPQDLPSKPDAKVTQPTLTPSAAPVTPPATVSPKEEPKAPAPKKASEKTAVAALVAILTTTGVMFWDKLEQAYHYLWSII